MTWSMSRKHQVSPFFFISLTIFSASQVSAGDSGNGAINIKGVIVERACAIEVGDRDQTFAMDTVPVSQIIRDGQGTKKSFNIRLVDCVLSRLGPDKLDSKYFTVTFSGEDDQGYFALSGKASGIALAITDEAGHQARNGYVMPPVAILPPEMIMSYSVNLVGNRKNLHAGDYQAAIRFTMNYN